VSGRIHECRYRDVIGLIEFDEEAGEFFGTACGLTAGGLVTFRGATLEDAEREFRASVDDYLDSIGEEPE
jgi:predicted HicB family RNase H-like nuclease